MMWDRCKNIVVAIFLVLICPVLLYSLTDRQSLQPDEQQSQQMHTTDPVEDDFRFSVLMDDGVITEMDMDSYITSVVLREMPAEFETEALRAQAVVARTYALRRFEMGGKHTDADVCTDPSCCQGFCTQEAYLSDGGTQALLDKVKTAVTSTSGQVLLYNGELIDATYFSCSGGRTEDAKAVWGADIPYLQSTESPGEEEASHYVDTVTFTKTEFADLLGAELSGNPKTWIDGITYTKGGGVDTIDICGNTYKGTTIRQLLGLRSTAFVISVVGDTVTVTTKGFGHRVGMSQYGADAMAVQGYGYEDILSHYYQNTQLTTYTGN